MIMLIRSCHHVRWHCTQQVTCHPRPLVVSGLFVLNMVLQDALYAAQVASGHVDWKVVALGRKSPMSPTVDTKNSCSDFFPRGLQSFFVIPRHRSSSKQQ